MKYYFNTVLKMGFEEVIEKVTHALKEEGFGILTEIDVRDTLEKKLHIDFRNYKILGACNPPFAHKALMAEDKVGTMLPCNVIVQQIDADTVEVAAINPIASMKAVDNKNLNDIAEEIKLKLKKVIDSL